MVFNATFIGGEYFELNVINYLTWQANATFIGGEHHQPAASHWKLYHNVAYLALSGIRTQHQWWQAPIA